MGRCRYSKKGIWGKSWLHITSFPRRIVIIVAVGHKEYRSMSMMQLKNLFKAELEERERTLLM